MSTPASPVGTTLLFGRDHTAYGEYALVAVSGHTAASISPGSDVEFLRSSAAKYDVNEDALLVREDARHTVMCVADAHFGADSAHALVALLADALDPVPQNPAQLDEVLRGLADGVATRASASETTLLICVHDRLFRQSFGVSFGDSSLVHVNADGVATQVNEKTPGFVTPAAPDSLAPSRAVHFSLSPRAGDLLLAYTDGIDECCYRDPDRSITLDVLGRAVRGSDGTASGVTRALVELALAGVGGNDGGQDNLAIAVTRV